MVRLMAYRALYAAGMGLEIAKRLGERRCDGGNTFTALLLLLFILQPH